MAFSKPQKSAVPKRAVAIRALDGDCALSYGIPTRFDLNFWTSNIIDL
jgi:hypothetical protein